MAWVYHNKPPMGWPLDLSEPINDGLIYYGLYNEGSGNIVQDLSGNGHTGIFNGNVAWGSGKYGSTIDKGGANADFISVATNPITVAPYTIVAWFWIDTLASASQDLSIFAVSDNSASDFILLRIGTADDKIDFSVRQESGTTRIATTTNTVPAQTWGMVAAVCHSASARDVYYNNTGKGSNGDAAAPVGLNTTVIGARDLGAVSDSMSGEISHIQIYNQALSVSKLDTLLRFPFYGFLNPDEEAVLDQYYDVAVGANPKGPLGHPLYGALAGPI